MPDNETADNWDRDELGRIVVSRLVLRHRFGEFIQMITENNETIVVEVSGEPAIVLVSKREYDDLHSELRALSGPHPPVNICI